ncbi:MAG: hypothetical protein ACLUSP_06415 [Christensenellales bacterium]
MIRIGENATLPVKNGGFVPDKAGEYRYAASAKDEAGNVTSVAYNFTVSEVLESIALSLADYDETIVKAGSRFVIPSIGASGGSGEKTISFTASLNGEPLYPDDLNRVYLHDRGELKIAATAIDYLSTTVTEELVINVLAESSPVIEVTRTVCFVYRCSADSSGLYGDGLRKKRRRRGSFPDRFVTIDGNLIYSVKGDVTDGSLTVNDLTVGKHIVRYCAGSPTRKPPENRLKSPSFRLLRSKTSSFRTITTNRVRTVPSFRARTATASSTFLPEIKDSRSLIPFRRTASERRSAGLARRAGKARPKSYFPISSTPKFRSGYRLRRTIKKRTFA